MIKVTTPESKPEPKPFPKLFEFLYNTGTKVLLIYTKDQDEFYGIVLAVDTSKSKYISGDFVGNVWRTNPYGENISGAFTEHHHPITIQNL